MTVDLLIEYPSVPFAHETCPRHRTQCQRSGANPGRSAVSRQSDVGVKVRVQSLISMRPTERPGSRSASHRQIAGFACRGVGHTARGREVPRELHLADVRLLHLISPWARRVCLDFPAFWCAAAWCDVRSTHRRSFVRKRIRTSVREVGGGGQLKGVLLQNLIL